MKTETMKSQFKQTLRKMRSGPLLLHLLLYLNLKRNITYSSVVLNLDVVLLSKIC